LLAKPNICILSAITVTPLLSRLFIPTLAMLPSFVYSGFSSAPSPPTS